MATEAASQLWMMPLKSTYRLSCDGDEEVNACISLVAPTELGNLVLLNQL